MLTVAALTLGANTPSARFRVRQFVPGLAAAGIAVTERWAAEPTLAPLASDPRLRAFQVAERLARRAVARVPQVIATWSADLTWLSKQLVVGVPSWERLLHGPLVLDVDDAMWMARPSGASAARTAARAASAVVVGNRFLERWYSQHNRKVVLIPTSIDTARFSLVSSPSWDPFTIGWTGSRATLPYLEAIEPALNAFFEQQPTARLLVVCDAPPRFHGRARHHLDFEAWTSERESELLGRMSVGIMPLLDDELARGKCSFKMLQYMARGLPVIVSPVGSNADILGQGEVGWGASGTDEWVYALRDCWKDPARAARLGRNGRALVESHYSANLAVEKLARLFTELATGKGGAVA